MVDLTITAANVVAGTNAVKKLVKAGATITAGQLVYRNSTTGKYQPVDSDSATAEARTPEGIALHGASDNQPLSIQTAGDITIGATVAVGTVYVASDTAGGIMPTTDLETGDYVTIVGVGISTSAIRLGFNSSGVAVP